MWRPINKFTKVIRQHCNLTICNSINPDEKTKKSNECLFLNDAFRVTKEEQENDKDSNRGRSNCSSGFFESIANNCAKKDVLGVGSSIAAAVHIERILDDEARATVNAMPIKEELVEEDECDDHVYETTESLQEIKHEIEALVRGLKGAKYYNSGRPAEAVKFWMESANYDHSYAFFNLGLAYELGNGVKKNISKAISFYEKASDHPKALYNLGAIYLKDESTKMKAHELIFKAADFGLAEAQTFMGVKYMLDGEEKKAVSLFKKAADQKNAEAEYYLGLCYQHGKGVDKNENYAIELFKRSSRKGNCSADEELKAKGIIQITLRQSSSSLTDYVKTHMDEFFQNNMGNDFHVSFNSENDPLSGSEIIKVM